MKTEKEKKTKEQREEELMIAKNLSWEAGKAEALKQEIMDLSGIYSIPEEKSVYPALLKHIEELKSKLGELAK